MRDFRRFFVDRDCDADGMISIDRANAVIRDFVEKERTLLYGALIEGVPSWDWHRGPTRPNDRYVGQLLFVEEAPVPIKSEPVIIP